MIQRFGKKSGDILDLIRPFFEKNDDLLRDCLKHAEIYTAQPHRKSCKVCDAAVSKSPTFRKQNVPYAICTRCGHLNGLHQDTLEFSKAIHGNSEYYDQFYSSTDLDAYRKRLQAIYLPKAKFLHDALMDHGHRPADLSYADFGAGSGYFVAALVELGLEKTIGLELSEVQVGHANRHVAGNRVRKVEFNNTISTLEKLDAEVISMVGVLEHLHEPRQVLAALKKNPKVKYLFITVPMFSLSVFAETAFQRGYPRHLSGDHTHLYTEKSLDWMAKEYGFSRAGEWWFGSDMMDLYRLLRNSLETNSETKGLVATWDSAMLPMIDSLQLQLDEKRLSSEVHLVFRKSQE